MGVTALGVGLIVAVSVGQPAKIQQEEIDYQNEVFKQWWETDLVWNFDALPAKGSVPDYRVPYSGHDYPDRAGGTANASRKYDLAFNDRRPLATEWERQDTGGDGRRRFGDPARPRPP